MSQKAIFSHMKGLTEKEAQNRLKKFGYNVLSTRNANPWWEIFGRQFTDMLVIILIVAAGISFFLGEETDAMVIMGIVLLNAGIGFFQEFKTERTLQALKNMIKSEVRIVRDGNERMIPMEEVVPGDLCILLAGDKIPADGVLKEAHVFRVEESALTGESVPVEKFVGDEVFMGTNVIFMGTSVVHGSGVMEVSHTGMNTRFGEIAKLSTETASQMSPLQKELSHIGVFVTKVTAVLCLFLFGIGILRGSNILDSFLFSVSVAIAAVPEGLPTTITIALALGATILAKKGAIVKRLSSAETLGAVTTICSDKTGTLTKNEMTVREIYLGDRSIYKISGAGYAPHGKIQFLGGINGSHENEKLLHDLLEICEKCNDSTLIKKHGDYIVLGDPTEGALLTLAEKYRRERGPLPFEKDDTIDEEFPFDSERKMMSVISDGNVLTKGSPDQLLAKCTHWTDGKNIYPLTDDKIHKIRTHYKRMASNALRVLAFAKKPIGMTRINGQGEGPLPKTDKQAERNLIFVGLVGMIDPPRPEVRTPVENCHTAGIRIIIVTGDYGITAKAIARELGIVEGDDILVLEGDKVEQMSDENLVKIIKDHDKPVIFARSLPAQKMRIVSLLQDQGEIVAMTGDGVNDAPALKKADIGVAMGITGTEVSKESASMILTDDSFASIVTAIEEGRRIYENLKKFVWFIFSCNIGELVVIFAAILFQFPLPLSAILILCVDLGTDILPAIALGVDPAEKGLMNKKPRNAKLKVLNKNFVIDFLITGFVIGISVTGAFLWTALNDGWVWGSDASIKLPHAMTVAFTSLVFVQMVNAFSARSHVRSLFTQNPFNNLFLVLSVFISILMVLSMIYLPALNTILKTTPLTTYDWWIVAIASLVPLIFVEGRKIFIRSKN